MVSFSKLKDLYPDNWPDISRRYKAKRNYTCEKCGKRYPKNSKWLHVHHIVSISKGGDPEDDSNLQALCFKCHQAEHNHMGGPSKPKTMKYSKPFA